MYDQVWKLKQLKTIEAIDQCIFPNQRLTNVLSELKQRGYLLYCASNSIWVTIKTFLLKMNILQYFDYFISNEEVQRPKPYPEIYLSCVARAGVSTSETLILEDSHIGRQSAQASGCWLCPIGKPDNVTLSKIYSYIKMVEESAPKNDLRWKQKVNIVIPMAGHGSRFSKAGYTDPKPLIKVNGKPMIQMVVENLNIDGHYIFIVQKDHAIGNILEEIAPGCTIIKIDQVTQGAACTVLLASEYIDSDVPLLIANSDQYLEWDSNEFMYFSKSNETTGCISTFRNSDPKWSFVSLTEDGFVKQVKEKVPISDIATTGIYYWSRGNDYVKYANQMIEKDIRVNNEFYVCPVYNEAIADGCKIKVKDCQKMWGIGTPEDLNFFIKNYEC